MKKFIPVNHDEERKNSSVTIWQPTSNSFFDSIAIFESQSDVMIVSLSLSNNGDVVV